MDKIPFVKYHGAGNDFIMIDGRFNQAFHSNDVDRIQAMCTRRFGIGADGLIMVQPHSDYDFEMLYFNADGRPGSMCGNGGRCAVAFAHELGLVDVECRFLAVDGPHQAKLINPEWVELQMIDVHEVESIASAYFLNTGSPHFVQFVENLEQIEVFKKGREIRYSERFNQEGTNVNFVEVKDGSLFIGTYERGVEDETLACGTGITAAAIANFLRKPILANTNINVIAKGGKLNVRFEVEHGKFKNIWLNGPAKRVYEGKI